MSMTHAQAIVLAAGLGTRMKSTLPKVLHPLCGQPMIQYVVDALTQAGMARIVVVVGHGASAVRQTVGDRVEYVVQANQAGTGHAVQQAHSLLHAVQGQTLVVCGDTPLITSATLRALLSVQQQTAGAATVLTGNVGALRGFGRIVRTPTGEVAQIIEEKECDATQRRITEINAGIYAFDNQKLFTSLTQLTTNNAQGEYYLTDVIEILTTQGERVHGMECADVHEIFGVNDLVALAQAEVLMRQRIATRHMYNGVRMVDPQTTYVDATVTIEPQTTIHPHTYLRGCTAIGARCTIGPGADLTDAIVHADVRITHSVVVNAVIGHDSTVGPFAYLRPGTHVAEHVKIGDFVEIKNTHIGKGSKIPHHAYVGDATIGQNVNIGCGVITANFDGISKYETHVGDGTFIGSNATLVAPLHIANEAFICAGSTITDDVGVEDMAIARTRQMNKPGYANALKTKRQQQPAPPRT